MSDLAAIEKQQQDLGILTARTLISEIGFDWAKAGFPIETIGDRCTELASPQYESSFLEYTKDKEKIKPVSRLLLLEMQANIDSAVAFCCISLQTDVKATFDIDHVCPREWITEKQKLLLDYLNDPENAVFTKAFMGEVPYMSSQIDKYFKRNEITNKVMGTKWFFDACYNNPYNLFYLKNHLNREKRAIFPEAWLTKHCPTPKLMEAINGHGGIHEGVIMQQVFRETGLQTVNLGKRKDKKGKEIGYDVVIYLHGGNNGIGLGTFIRHWSKTNAQRIINNSGQMGEIKAKFHELLKDELNNSSKEGLEKILSFMNEILLVTEERRKMALSGGSVSSQDTSVAAAERQDVDHDKILEAFTYMHSVKKVKKLVLSLTTEDGKADIKENFFKYCRELGLIKLNIDNIAEARDHFIQKCQGIAKDSLTPDDVKMLLREAIKAADPIEKFRKRAVEAEQREAEQAKIAEQRLAEINRLQKVIASMGEERAAEPTASSRKRTREDGLSGSFLPGYSNLTSTSVRDVAKLAVHADPSYAHSAGGIQSPEPPTTNRSFRR